MKLVERMLFLDYSLYCRLFKETKINDTKGILGKNEAISRVYCCLYRTHYTIGYLNTINQLPIMQCFAAKKIARKVGSLGGKRES